MLSLLGVPSLPTHSRTCRAYHRHADRSFRRRARPVTDCVVPVFDPWCWFADFRHVTVLPDALGRATGRAVKASSSAPSRCCWLRCSGHSGRAAQVRPHRMEGIEGHHGGPIAVNQSFPAAVNARASLPSRIRVPATVRSIGTRCAHPRIPTRSGQRGIPSPPQHPLDSRKTVPSWDKVPRRNSRNHPGGVLACCCVDIGYPRMSRKTARGG